MKFSLQNIVVAIALIAFSLGLLLSDQDSQLQARAQQLEQDKQLLRESKSYHLPVSKRELREAIKNCNFNDFDMITKN